MTQFINNVAIDFDRLLSTSDIEVDTQMLVPIDSGFSSDVYQTDEHVVKLLKPRYHTRISASDHADLLYGEQEEVQMYIDQRNIEIAHLVVGRSTSRDYRVLMVQNRIVGPTMAEALRTGATSERFEGYLSRGLQMHKRTRKIPDLACLENLFNPLVDPNTKVSFNGEAAIPILVDTTYGRTQRRPHIGKLFHRGIAYGVEHALQQLQDEVEES